MAEPGQGLLRGWLSRPVTWMWVAALLAILVAGSLLWLQNWQRQTLARSLALQQAFRLARVDLARGFLYVSLADEPSSPYNRAQGVVWLGQAATTLESTLQLSSEQSGELSPSEAASVTAFRKSVDAFLGILEQYNANPQPDARLLTRLRIAFHEVEQGADEIDRLTDARYQRLSTALQIEFDLVSLLAVVLVAGICVIVYLVGRYWERSTAALQASESRYRLLADNMVDVIWLLDLDSGRFTYVSPSVQRLRGYTPDEVLSRPLEAALTPESLEIISQKLPVHIQAALSGDRSHLVTVEFLDQPCKDGSIVPTEVVSNLILDARGAPVQVLGVSRDIRERRQAEAAQAALLQALQEKTEEMESLLYAASHDLRSPLINILGFSQRLESANTALQALFTQAQDLETLRQQALPLLAERFSGSLKFIHTSAQRMDLLINGLLRLSRLGRTPLNPVFLDMDILVDSVLAAQQHQAQQAGAEIIREPLPGCWGDALQIGQVFTNLVDNTIKYRSLERPLRVQISGFVDGAQAVYCVADNGLGIDERSQPKVWGIFSRLEEAGPPPGEGLGLTLVRRIVHRHSGRVWLESVPGQGSRFFISLPQRPFMERVFTSISPDRSS